jgi:hypothetical protein
LIAGRNLIVPDEPKIDQSDRHSHRRDLPSKRDPIGELVVPIATNGDAERRRDLGYGLADSLVVRL